jgi:hypothetical protein
MNILCMCERKKYSKEWLFGSHTSAWMKQSWARVDNPVEEGSNNYDEAGIEEVGCSSVTGKREDGSATGLRPGA